VSTTAYGGDLACNIAPDASLLIHIFGGRGVWLQMSTVQSIVNCSVTAAKNAKLPSTFTVVNSAESRFQDHVPPIVVTTAKATFDGPPRFV
jgi:hypothetical protein